jgi:hypothetical protein
MARRRYGRRRGRRSFKIPIVTVAILAGQALTAGAGSGSAMDVLNNFQSFYTGFYNGTFQPAKLLFGWGPWIAKGLVSKVAGPIGRPRIPFGLPFSLS